MFQVISRDQLKLIRDVYAVRYGTHRTTKFLVFEPGVGWVWVDSVAYKPHFKDPPTDDNKPLRKNDLLFEVIEYARNLLKRTRFSDWKDADDFLFSNLDITKKEVEEIYRGRHVMIYTASCRDDKEATPNDR